MARLPHDANAFAAAATDAHNLADIFEYAAFVAARLPEKTVTCEFTTMATALVGFVKSAAKIMAEAQAAARAHPGLPEKLAKEWADHQNKTKKRKSR